VSELNINKTIVAGRLEREPNIGQTNNGKKVANLVVVTDESYLNADGAKVEKFEKHKVVAWGKQAALCEELKKDDYVCVEGKNQTRRTESGVLTEIVATSIKNK